jgi:hypothetical protein
MLTLTTDTLINYGALATMLLGVYALYLCLVYDRRVFYSRLNPVRRKR